MQRHEGSDPFFKIFWDSQPKQYKFHDNQYINKQILFLSKSNMYLKKDSEAY